jgi:lipoate-protein ligase A
MSSTSQARWRLERVSLTTATLHEAWPRLTEGERLCRVAEPIDRALVLGSSTGEEGFDLQRVRREGITVVRRHSGGGAVLVEPGDQIWLMLYLRLDDPLVLRDLGSSFLWLGTAVRNLLEGLGVEGRVVTERQERTELGRMICFADLGFGELTIGDAKVLGLAQRRSRGQACFQLSLLWNERQSEISRFLRDSDLANLPLRVAGIAPRVALSRQRLQDRLIQAITTL